MYLPRIVFRMNVIRLRQIGIGRIRKILHKGDASYDDVV